MDKLKYILLSPLIFLTIPALATTLPQPDTFKNLEISVAAGINAAHTNNTYLVITPYETDSLRIRNTSHTAPWKIGVGFHAFRSKLESRHFINDLLLELNLYRSSETVRGSVWQYQFPQFNNYDFRAPITNTRLMLDIKPSLFKWHQISPYPVIGVGIGINNTSYYETVTGIGVDPTSFHSLHRATNINVVYEVGAGARMKLTTRLIASLEYLYTNLGIMSPDGTPTTNVALSSPPKFSISSQAVLLGLNWII